MNGRKCRLRLRSVQWFKFIVAQAVDTLQAVYCDFVGNAMAIPSISSNLAALAAPRSTSSSEDTRTELQKRLEELQKQLAEVMKRIKAVQNSNATDEAKAQQIQALNTRASTISGQIKMLMSKQLQELKQS